MTKGWYDFFKKMYQFELRRFNLNAVSVFQN